MQKKGKLFVSMILVLVSSAMAEDKSHQLILQTAEEASILNEKINKVGQIESQCPDCKMERAHKSYEINSEVIQLERPYFIKDNDTYLIHLKRSSLSPTKIQLNFKNGQRVCGRYLPYMPSSNSALRIECLAYTTQYEDEVLDIDLSSLPLLKTDESEIIEIRLSKANINKLDYSVDLNLINNKKNHVEKNKKFWSSGYNFKISQDK